MRTQPYLSPKRAVVVFVLALLGAVTGVLLGPLVVQRFSGSPEWLLPTVVGASVLFALVAVRLAFAISTRSRQGPSREA